MISLLTPPSLSLRPEHSAFLDSRSLSREVHFALRASASCPDAPAAAVLDSRSRCLDANSSSRSLSRSATAFSFSSSATATCASICSAWLSSSLLLASSSLSRSSSMDSYFCFSLDSCGEELRGRIWLAGSPRSRLGNSQRPRGAGELTSSFKCATLLVLSSATAFSTASSTSALSRSWSRVTLASSDMAWSFWAWSLSTSSLLSSAILLNSSIMARMSSP